MEIMGLEKTFSISNDVSGITKFGRTTPWEKSYSKYLLRGQKIQSDAPFFPGILKLVFLLVLILLFNFKKGNRIFNIEYFLDHIINYTHPNP